MSALGPRPGWLLGAVGPTFLLLDGYEKKTQRADVISKDCVPAARANEALTDERQLDYESWLISVDVTPEVWRAPNFGGWV